MFARFRSYASLMPIIAALAMLIAPAVHQFEHGRAHHEHALEVASETGHVHATSESFSRALENVRHETFLCIVCKTHLKTVTPQRFDAPPLAAVERAPSTRTSFPADTAPRDQLARAPPVAHGDQI